MCGGPTAAQENLQNEESQFYATQIQSYNTAYANYSQLQQTLTQQFAPVLAAGPGQTGFTDQETNALNTQAIEGTASNYQQAEETANAAINARGGGNDTTNITSGTAQQLNEEIASTAAGTESAEELGVTQSNFAQGRQNYENAISGEEEVASGWNPNTFAGSATNAAGAANTEADAIAQEQDSVWSSVMGALGGVAGEAVGNLNVGPFGKH
jgi:hypothetical protein